MWSVYIMSKRHIMKTCPKASHILSNFCKILTPSKSGQQLSSLIPLCWSQSCSWSHFEFMYKAFFFWHSSYTTQCDNASLSIERFHWRHAVFQHGRRNAQTDLDIQGSHTHHARTQSCAWTTGYSSLFRRFS